MVFFLLFLFGIVIGSFLNVVTMRYQLLGRMLATGRIAGHSRCPQCKNRLRWYELIPLVSFVIQGRKCRHCPYRLSWQYPAVELIAGALTAAIPLFFYHRFAVAPLVAAGEPLGWFFAFCGLWLLAAYTFIVLSVIDLKYTIIPDAANVLLGIIGVALVALRAVYEPFLTYNGSFIKNYALFMPLAGASAWVQALAAAGVGVALFGGIILATRGRGMGLGDLKLVVPIGLLMGWPDAIFVLGASFIIGAVVSVGLMLSRKKSFKDGVPFGPFLAAAVFVVMFFGETIMKWYFSLL